MNEKLCDLKKEGRTFISFNLSGDTAFDNITLMAVEYTIRKLRREDDTTRVVKLHFTACVTYGQFVQLINIMKLETQPIYAYSGDDLYAWEVADRW